MIKHIVPWKLKDHVEGRSKAESAAMLKRELESMVGRIPGLRSCEVGINFNPGQDAFDLSLYSEFATKQDLEAYQVHPEHQRVIALLRPRRDERIVVDYEV